MTDAENRLWFQLRRRQLVGYFFRRQASMNKYIVDFVCHKAKLIIELDGGQRASQLVYDDQRTNWLNAQGYQVLRFWNDEEMNNLDGVVENIRKNLVGGSKSPPSLILPHQGGGNIGKMNLVFLRHQYRSGFGMA